MPRTHYRLWYRINAVDHFLLWFSKEQDCLVTDSEGRIPSFRTESALLAYAETLSIVVQPEDPLLLNLDLVQFWLANPRPQLLAPETFLSAWNLFGDVARTLPAVGSHFTERDSLLLPLYDKLFWANNLPAVMPEEMFFAPEWSAIEIGELTALLREGLDMFIRSLREGG